MRVPEVSSYSRDLTPARRSLCYVNRDSSPASDDFHPSKLIFVMRAHIALLKKDCRESGGGGGTSTLFTCRLMRRRVTKCTRARDIRIVN